jgi:hypothetical protein
LRHTPLADREVLPSQVGTAPVLAASKIHRRGSSSLNDKCPPWRLLVPQGCGLHH